MTEQMPGELIYEYTIQSTDVSDLLPSISTRCHTRVRSRSGQCA